MLQTKHIANVLKTHPQLIHITKWDILFYWRINYVDVFKFAYFGQRNSKQKKIKSIYIGHGFVCRLFFAFAFSFKFLYLVKFVKQTCLTNAAGGCRFDIADAKSYCCSILKRIISTRWTGSRWKRKLFMYDRCFISSINVWLPTFGTRLKNNTSIIALFVLFNSAALGMTSGIRVVVDRC